MIPTIKTEDSSSSSQSKTTTNVEVPVESDSSDIIEEEVEETLIVKRIKRTRRSRTPSPRPSPRIEYHIVQNGHDEDNKIESSIIINEMQDTIDSSNLEIKPKLEADEGEVVINKLNGELGTVQYSQPKSSPKNLDLNLQKPNASGMKTTRDAVKEIDEDALSSKAKNCCFSCLSLCAFLDDCVTCRGSGS